MDGLASVPADVGRCTLEPLGVALLSPILIEARTLAALSACNGMFRDLIQAAGDRLWQHACDVSLSAGYAPNSVLQGVSCWRSFLRGRTPGEARVLGEAELKENEQLDWFALVPVIGAARSGKTSLVQRLVSQNAPGHLLSYNWAPLGAGIRSCVLEAFGLRGRLRLFEISEDKLSVYAQQLRKADAIIVVCDQEEGPEGITSALQLLASVEATVPPLKDGRPSLLTLAKSDCVQRSREVYCAGRAVLARAANAELVEVSARDGSGIQRLLHVLAWRLIGSSVATRQHLMERQCPGGNRLFHRTAGAMTPQQVLDELLQRSGVSFA